MNDHVIDTNVLLVASAAHPHSPFDDTHVPAEEQRAVFEWLTAFRGDAERRLVLDAKFRIYEEYRNKLTDQDYGLQVIAEKLGRSSFTQVEVRRDEYGHAIVPAAFSRFDRSDRQLLAAALTDPASISIVNACDSDWLVIETELAAAGVRVVHLVETWLRAQHQGRR